jgi:hypothetical protein
MLPLSIYLFIIHVAISRQYCFSRDSTPPPLKREQNKCNNSTQGRIHGAHPARIPPKIGKKYDFLAQNRDVSHEIPQKFSRLLPLGAIFLSAPPNLKSWIRPCD